MVNKITSAVIETEDGLFTFVCPGDPTDPCGDATHTFRSSGWPTQEVASARGQQHIEAHVYKTSMPHIDDFKAEQGIAEPSTATSEKVDLSTYLNSKKG